MLCAWCRAQPDCPPEVFWFLAWLLNGSSGDSRNTAWPTHRLLKWYRRPQRILLSLLFWPCGPVKSPRHGASHYGCNSWSFRFGGGSRLVGTGAAGPPGTKPWWQVELPAGEGKLMRKGSPFWADRMGLRQKMVVPLWLFDIYLYYTWFLRENRCPCCFAMETVAFSASIPARSSSKWPHSRSRDLTGLPVSAAISVAAVTFYYRFMKSLQCSIHCEIMQTTLSFYFFSQSLQYSFPLQAISTFSPSLPSCPVYYIVSQQ